MTQTDEMSTQVRRVAVLVACTDWFYREALASLFRSTDDIELLGAIPLDTQALEPLHTQRPDVILVELPPPRTNADDHLAFVRSLRRTAPAAKVIAVGVYPRRDELPLLRLGVSAMLRRGEVHDGRHILSTVYSVADDLIVVPSALRQEMVRYMRESVVEFYDLTRRERDVLMLLAQGHTNKEIAAETSFALQTIKNTVRSILKKLNVPNRREAARIARSRL